MHRLKRHAFSWFLLPSVLLILLMAFPLVVVVLRGASNDIFANLIQPTSLSALRLSLLTSAISLCVTVVLGTPLAFGMTQWRFRGRGVIETLVDLPVVLPPAVAGLALLMAFGRRGTLGAFFGALGVSLPFTTTAVVLAQIFVAAPFYIRAARIGFGAIDPHYEEAALVEGASAWQIFTRVMIPIAQRSLISGMILMWARALGEFGATILFAGNLEGVSQTMPLAIYIGFERNSDSALALSVVLILLSAALMLLLRRVEADAARSN